MKRLHFAATLLALFAIAAGVVPAQAQDHYPSRPIKLVVGYPPGGSVDVVARILADHLAPRLEAPVVVENDGGAAGAIGAARVVASPADGYTLLVGSSNELVGTGVLNREQKYDARRDFAPVGMAASAPLVLVAGTRTGVHTLTEFIETVRRNPGRFSYGSPGVGSTMHFAGELAKQRANLFITHIPYRGVSPLTGDLVGNVIEFGFMSPPAAVPLIQSGRLVGLGVSGKQRLAALPQVPAMTEHPALTGYELTGWIGLLGPKGLPGEVEHKLRQALQVVLADPSYRKKIDDIGGVPASGQEDLARLIGDETEKYLRLAAFAKLR
jgi:tripartite-type tricarboxylate transporter receptor subunit TctC